MQEPHCSAEGGRRHFDFSLQPERRVGDQKKRGLEETVEELREEAVSECGPPTNPYRRRMAPIFGRWELVQRTLEQHGFEPHGSTLRLTVSNKHTAALEMYFSLP